MAVEPLPIVRASELDAAPLNADWLVHNVWTRASVGIIGGAPKCCKSFFGLDLAVSIASGTPCLDAFEVDNLGRALIYLAEDTLPEQKKRLVALCEHRGLDINRLDVHVITAPVLRLDVEADRQRLSAAIERLRPAFLLLDPLVRLHRLDENSAMEISGLLSVLRGLQRTYEVAVALVHHASKKARARPGQALRGSSDIHAFGDDFVHLARPNDHDLVLTLEHRSAPSLDPMRLKLVSRTDGRATHLELADAPPTRQNGPPDERVIAILRTSERTCTRQELRDRLRINNQRLGDILATLEQAGRVTRATGGWPIVPLATVPTTAEPLGPTGAQVPLFEVRDKSSVDTGNDHIPY